MGDLKMAVTKKEASTEVALIAPEYAVAAYGTTDDNLGGLMGSGAIAIPRISTRRRKFTLIRDEVEVVKPSDSFIGTILHAGPGAGLYSKTYFSSEYVQGQTAKPDCMSSDGIKPDSWCENPQSDFCRTCPMDQFGSKKSRTGKDAKACKDSKRLFIVPEDDPENIYLLQIPQSNQASKKHLTGLGMKIRAGVKTKDGQTVRMPMMAYKVKFGMDEDSDFPVVTYELVGVHDEATMVTITQLKESAPWESEVEYGE
jgi:hypothetical protein